MRFSYFSSFFLFPSLKRNHNWYGVDICKYLAVIFSPFQSDWIQNSWIINMQLMSLQWSNLLFIFYAKISAGWENKWFQKRKRRKIVRDTSCGRFTNIYFKKSVSKSIRLPTMIHRISLVHEILFFFFSLPQIFFFRHESKIVRSFQFLGVCVCK